MFSTYFFLQYTTRNFVVVRYDFQQGIIRGQHTSSQTSGPTTMISLEIVDGQMYVGSREGGISPLE